MTKSVLLTDLDQGYAFETIGFRVTPDWVSSYCRIVGDESRLYFDKSIAPPLGVLARGLGDFMETTPLPDGTLHRNQTLRILGTVPLDAYVEIDSQILTMRKRRVSTVIEIEFSARLHGEQEPVFTAVTTLLNMNMDALSGREGSASPDLGSGEFPWWSEHRMRQENVILYADEVNDHNPIHLDENFAAGTPFRGTIVHGMLVLATLPALLVRNIGMPWLENGSLDVHFGAPTKPGDIVRACARVESESREEQGLILECQNQRGEVLIAGKAGVFFNTTAL